VPGLDLVEPRDVSGDLVPRRILERAKVIVRLV
jgi:hypothetical protein